MNQNLEQHDELCRIWQATELAGPIDDEGRNIMELVQTRGEAFHRTIFWRNAREYVAALLVAGLFALMANHTANRLEQLGFTIVSISGLWVCAFLWLTHRSRNNPRQDVDGKAYGRTLLRNYDRQILLLRTAGIWYALPFTAGSVLAGLGNAHAPVIGSITAGFTVLVWLGITLLNWKAAQGVAAEKQELQALLDEAE